MSAEFELCFCVNATGISLRSSSLIITTICIPLSSPLFFFCFLFLSVCFCFSSCHKRQEWCRVDWLQAGNCLPFIENREQENKIRKTRIKNASFFVGEDRRRQLHLEDGQTPEVCTGKPFSLEQFQDLLGRLIWKNKSSEGTLSGIDYNLRKPTSGPNSWVSVWIIDYCQILKHYIIQYNSDNGKNTQIGSNQLALTFPGYSKRNEVCLLHVYKHSISIVDQSSAP